MKLHALYLFSKLLEEFFVRKLYLVFTQDHKGFTEVVEYDLELTMDLHTLHHLLHDGSLKVLTGKPKIHSKALKTH